MMYRQKDNANEGKYEKKEAAIRIISDTISSNVKSRQLKDNLKVIFFNLLFYPL